MCVLILYAYVYHALLHDTGIVLLGVYRAYKPKVIYRNICLLRIKKFEFRILNLTYRNKKYIQ